MARQRDKLILSDAHVARVEAEVREKMMAETYGLQLSEYRALKPLIEEDLRDVDLGSSGENDVHSLLLWFLFGDAYKHLSREKALAIFQSGEIRRIAAPAALIFEFVRVPSPLYSLEELARLTHDFIRHQEANRDNLITAGYPLRAFEPSRWMDDLMGRLAPLHHRKPDGTESLIRGVMPWH